MTVKDFIETYNGDVDHLKINEYVPIETKLGVINSTLDKLIDSEGRISATFNSVAIEIAGVLAAITIFSDLEATSIDDYDRLIETGLINNLVYYFGKDYKEFMRLYEMRVHDIIREKNSIDAVIGRLIQKFADIIDSIDTNELMEILSSFDPGE